ncbi:MAG: hypothetical protein OEZ47_08970, partial [Gammaproteobacteria bacterium]|nr:hypothetical protein [Gammaproteobacteria bacterium]
RLEFKEIYGDYQSSWTDIPLNDSAVDKGGKYSELLAYWDLPPMQKYSLSKEFILRLTSEKPNGDKFDSYSSVKLHYWEDDLRVASVVNNSCEIQEIQAINYSYMLYFDYNICDPIKSGLKLFHIKNRSTRDIYFDKSSTRKYGDLSMNYVVFTEVDSSFSDGKTTQVYAYNINTGLVDQITTGVGAKEYVKTDGNYLVYFKNYELHLYNLVTKESKFIGGATPDYFFQKLTIEMSNGGVFLIQTNSFNKFVVAYDIATGNWKNLPGSANDWQGFTADANSVIFPSGAFLYRYDLKTESFDQFPLTQVCTNPSVDGDQVALSCQGNVFIYDLKLGTETQITDYPLPVRNPMLSKGRLVWDDPRENRSFQIYTVNQAPKLYGMVKREVKVGERARLLVWGDDPESDYLNHYISKSGATTPYSSRRVLVGDLNEDGLVNSDDIILVKANLFKTISHPDFNPLADLDGNGAVGFFDFVKIYQQTIYEGTSPARAYLIDWVPTSSDLGKELVINSRVLDKLNEVTGVTSLVVVQ